jgi:hypothetical protein
MGNIISNFADKLLGGIGLGSGSDVSSGLVNMVADDAEKRKKLLGGGAAGMKKGGSVSSASKRADGIAQRGKTRGKMY